MKALALCALVTASLAAGALVPQQRRVLTARSADASLGEAVERAYSREVTMAQEEPPYSLEEIQEAALSWRIMSTRRVPKRAARVSRNEGPLDVAIDKMDANGQRATVTVTKRFSGVFYRRPAKASRVRATAHFRHLWMKSGSEWLLMTSTLTKAQMSIDGQAFSPDRKYFNPNNAFRGPTPFNPTGREQEFSAP